MILIFVGFVSGLLVAVLARLADMWREKRAIPRYKNLKNGQIYKWIALGIDCTNVRAKDMKLVVIYRDLKGRWFTRDEGEFKEKFVEANPPAKGNED